jgi:hypothetical protein
MTIFDASICWAVLAPLSTSELRDVAAREWESEFPYAIDPPPWETLAGARNYNALISRSPGSEGSDRHFAEILSRLAHGRAVYSLWFDPERKHVFEWKNGREVSRREEDPVPVAESLGFIVSLHTVPDDTSYSVAVVEGASVDEVRRALGDVADEGWIHVTPGPIGVLITATDGRLGTESWDVAEALPSATVYDVQLRPEAFSVLVLRGPDEVGRFRVPALDSDVTMLPDIKGERTPSAILAALGIPPEALGRGRV